LRAPVQAAVDLLEAIPPIGYLIVRAEQPARHRFALVAALAGDRATVADRQLAEHPTQNAIEVAARRQVRQEGLVLPLDRLPVGPVHVRIVEVVAIDAPGLVKDLPPLGPRLDADFDRRDVQLALAR